MPVSSTSRAHAHEAHAHAPAAPTKPTSKKNQAKDHQHGDNREHCSAETHMCEPVFYFATVMIDGVAYTAYVKGKITARGSICVAQVTPFASAAAFLKGDTTGVSLGTPTANC